MVSENGDILWIRQKIAIFNNIYLPENPFILIISLLLPLMSTIQEQGKEGIQKVDRVVFWKLKLLLQLHKSYITRFAQWQVLSKRFYRHSCFKTNQGRKLIYNWITEARLKVMKECNKRKENHKQDWNVPYAFLN